MSSVRLLRIKLIIIGLLFALLHLYTPSLVGQTTGELTNAHAVNAQSVTLSNTSTTVVTGVDESIQTQTVPYMKTYEAVATPTFSVNTTLTDAQKVVKVHDFLVSRNAPLADYATQIVQDADKYGIDYRLVAAISIMESSGGMYDFRSYNAWGWGNFSFSSYDQSIDAMSGYLKSEYINLGLTSPFTIAPKYCPPNSYHWAAAVSSYMEQMQ